MEKYPIGDSGEARKGGRKCFNRKMEGTRGKFGGHLGKVEFSWGREEGFWWKNGVFGGFGG